MAAGSKFKTLFVEFWRWVLCKRWWIIGVCIAGAAAALMPVAYARLSTQYQRYDANKTSLPAIPDTSVAIVFGAGVLPNGTPSRYLMERVDTAVALYKAGRVKTLLMSGDNSSDHYNEPRRMQEVAVKAGVPAQSIVLDYAGYSTYDSCWRARHIFGVKRATLVTQAYHLPRAVMTCQGLGLQSVGVSVRHTKRDWTVAYLLREVISTDKAAFQLLTKPDPRVSGHPEPTIP